MDYYGGPDMGDSYHLLKGEGWWPEDILWDTVSACFVCHSQNLLGFAEAREDVPQKLDFTTRKYSINVQCCQQNWDTEQRFTCFKGDGWHLLLK